MISGRARRGGIAVLAAVMCVTCAAPAAAASMIEEKTLGQEAFYAGFDDGADEALEYLLTDRAEDMEELPQEDEAVPKKVRKGWVTLKNGKKRYYKNGKYLTGFQTIGKKRYYFNRIGYMQTGGKKINGIGYYFNEKGAMLCYRTDEGFFYPSGKKISYNLGYKKMTQSTGKKSGWFTENGYKVFYYNGKIQKGLQKAGSYYYYFDQAGHIVTGAVTVGSTKYFFHDNGRLDMTKTSDGNYYDASGAEISWGVGYDNETFYTAKRIVSEITNDSQSDQSKLMTCFNWVISKPYITIRSFYFQSNWVPLYANDHFLGRGGTCMSDGAAFAYLAKAIGYKNVYVVCDTDHLSGAHCWTEINGLVYDPLFAEAKDYWRYWACDYYTYGLPPILRIRMS